MYGPRPPGSVPRFLTTLYWCIEVGVIPKTFHSLKIVFCFAFCYIDERQSCGSLSPPPSLEPSALSLTKMPTAIQDMQMLLHEQISDSEGEPAPAHSDRLSSGRRDKAKRVNAQPRKITRSSNTSANLPPTERFDPVDNPTNVSEPMKENSEKENDSKRQERSVVNNNSSGHVYSDLIAPSDLITKRKSTTKHDLESTENVLAEHRTNRNPSLNTGTSKLCNGGVRSAELERLDNTSVRPSVSFVVTRLPKQFAVSNDCWLFLRVSR